MTSISFQLFSARNAPDFEGLLSLLSETGYEQVEGYPEHYADPSATQKALVAAGLSMPSGHFPLDLLEETPEKAIEIANTLGISRIYCPYLEEADRPTTEDGWKDLAQRLSVIADKMIAAGFVFGWHNHDFEFVKVSSGAVPMAILLDTAPNMTWEADIAWIVRGGENPLEWIERYADRLSAVHVKDIAPAGECADEDGWADVGHGTMDWPTLIAALKKTPAALFVVEHDNPSDIARFAKRALTNVQEYLG